MVIGVEWANWNILEHDEVVNDRHGVRQWVIIIGGELLIDERVLVMLMRICVTWRR